MEAIYSGYNQDYDLRDKKTWQAEDRTDKKLKYFHNLVCELRMYLTQSRGG